MTGPTDWEQWVTDFTGGKAITDIAAGANVTVQTVRRRLIAAGVLAPGRPARVVVRRQPIRIDFHCAYCGKPGWRLYQRAVPPGDKFCSGRCRARARREQQTP